MQFQVKICGVTNVGDAVEAVEAGAGAIGLNFYSGSRRCVCVDDAQQIREAVGSRATCVGVFVNASADEIRDVCTRVGLHTVQLHGDEPPALLRQLNSSFDIIRARRLDDRGPSAIVDDIEACRELAGVGPDAILVDAAVGDQFGGTGHSFDWKQLAKREAWWRMYPLILAGGLTPENVAEAIRIVQPHAVDVASGVESAPGRKDRAKMRDFLTAALVAFS